MNFLPLSLSFLFVVRYRSNSSLSVAFEFPFPSNTQNGKLALSLSVLISNLTEKGFFLSTVVWYNSARTHIKWAFQLQRLSFFLPLNLIFFEEIGNLKANFLLLYFFLLSFLSRKWESERKKERRNEQTSSFLQPINSKLRWQKKVTFP